MTTTEALTNLLSMQFSQKLHILINQCLSIGHLINNWDLKLHLIAFMIFYNNKTRCHDKSCLQSAGLFCKWEIEWNI